MTRPWCITFCLFDLPFIADFVFVSLGIVVLYFPFFPFPIFCSFSSLWIRVSLCIPGWPRTPARPAPASQVPASQTCLLVYPASPTAWVSCILSASLFWKGGQATGSVSYKCLVELTSKTFWAWHLHFVERRDYWLNFFNRSRPMYICCSSWTCRLRLLTLRSLLTSWTFPGCGHSHSAVYSAANSVVPLVPVG